MLAVYVSGVHGNLTGTSISRAKILITSATAPAKYFIGLDEAGYGPNLGPLVVGGTLWRTTSRWDERQFCEEFPPVFAARPWSPSCAHVPLGDSKMLYQPGKGLATLEHGLLAMHGLQATQPCRDLGQLLYGAVNPSSAEELLQTKWYRGCDALPVPAPANSESAAASNEIAEVVRLTQVAQCRLDELQIELVAVKADVVTESRFNSLVTQSGSKGHLLSRTTLRLMVELIQLASKREQLPIEVFCDRQGGRKNYLPNLIDALPGDWFTQIAVSSQRSSYRNQSQPGLTIHFSVGGDSFPPTALASMLAKYLRERLMQQLNAFWKSHLPMLAPTAGYPVDAKRFRQSIEPVARRLHLPPETWWRMK